MCIIINQKLYKNGEKKMKPRTGTDLDCSRLDETFKMLGYKRIILSNVTLSQMATQLKDARDEIEDDCSSLVVCILAHGQEGVNSIKRQLCSNNLLQAQSSVLMKMSILLYTSKRFLMQLSVGL